MAQIVTRQQLFQLINSSSQVDEIEKQFFSYSEFCNQHLKCIADGKRHEFRGELDDGEDKYKFAYDKIVATYLRSLCPPIKFVGRGSSRTAFALEGGKCLKVANNAKGVGQNKQECMTATQKQYQCFTQVFDNSRDWTSLMTECCAKAIDDDFMKMLGVNPEQLKGTLRAVIHWHGVDPTLRELDYILHQLTNGVDIDDIDDEFGVVWKFNIDTEFKIQQSIKLLENVKKSKSTQFKVLYDLLKFYEDHKWNEDCLLTGDLAIASNWGLAIRDGKACLVVLDFGFSKEIANKYY